jgi:hypothetical protein
MPWESGFDASGGATCDSEGGTQKMANAQMIASTRKGSQNLKWILTANTP